MVRIREGDEWKSAFRTPFGHFECTVLWEGMTNAPATFQRLVNNVLRPYLDKICVAYLDDILVYSRNERQHIEDVKNVLEALQGARLWLKPKKCHFHKTEVTYLSY